jgi:hypothetical protein
MSAAAAMHRGEKARTEKRIMSYGWATSSLSLPDTGKLFSDDVSAAPSLTDHNHSGKKSSPLREEEAASSRRELPCAEQ